MKMFRADSIIYYSLAKVILDQLNFRNFFVIVPKCIFIGLPT